MPEPGNKTVHFRIAPSLRGQVVALRAQGRSKSRIARELGVNRRTVDKVIREYATDAQQCTVIEHVRRIVPKALDVIENKLDNEDAEFSYAMRFIEYAVPQETIAPQVNPHPGITLVHNIAMQLGLPQVQQLTAEQRAPLGLLQTAAGLPTVAANQAARTIAVKAEQRPLLPGGVEVPKPDGQPVAAPGVDAPGDPPPHVPAPAFDRGKALREADEHALREELAAREDRNAARR